MQKFCGHCGSEIRTGSSFCPSCGAPIVSNLSQNPMSTSSLNRSAATTTNSLKKLWYTVLFLIILNPILASMAMVKGEDGDEIIALSAFEIFKAIFVVAWIFLILVSIIVLLLPHILKKNYEASYLLPTLISSILICLFIFILDGAYVGEFLDEVDHARLGFFGGICLHIETFALIVMTLITMAKSTRETKHWKMNDVHRL